MDTPWTNTERRRVTVNLLIRLAIVGVLTWRIAVNATHGSVWGTAVYAVLDFLIFAWTVGFAWYAIRDYQRTNG